MKWREVSPMACAVRLSGFQSQFLGALTLGLFLAVTGPGRGTDTVVYSFLGPSSDGALPLGDVTISGNFLYGMTSQGGRNNAGSVFQISTDGSPQPLLHSFSSTDNPPGSLLQIGSTFYGMTKGDGVNTFGTIFSLTTGNIYNTLHTFTGSSSDGANPLGSLVVSGDGNTLYGMTQAGGAGLGTIFSIGVDGSGFSSLHSFMGGASDGSLPSGSLTLSGSTLYGMTANGGANNDGMVFQFDINTSALGVVHAFDLGGGEGSNPQGNVLLSAGVLYGMTTAGGTHGAGSIFRVDTTGSNYTTLHDFEASVSDNGSVPLGSLTAVGSVLYGTTSDGGANGFGTVFHQDMNDPNGFTLDHSFAGGNGDGATPSGSLVVADGVAYGTTANGGSSGKGTVFSVAVVPEPGIVALVIVAGGMLTLRRRRREW